MISLERTPEGLWSAAGAPAGFRIGVAGRGSDRCDYDRDAALVRADERELLSSLTGLAADRFAFLSQVHGDTIVAVDGRSGLHRHSVAEADGLMTDEPDLALVIRTADCVPLFVCDRDRRVIGAAHSGWRGCHAGIAGKLVAAMEQRYGCDAGTLCAFILPAIGPDAYEVGSDVASLFHPSVRREHDGKINLDLWLAVEGSLRDAGVPAASIVTYRRCTFGHNDEFYSHRRGDAGRNLNFGFLSGGNKFKNSEKTLV